jgi:glycosyltransferase involved in cell wall biosynthesis
MAICTADGLMVRKTDKSLCTHDSPIRCHQCRPDRSLDDFFIKKMWIQKNLAHVDMFSSPTKFTIRHYVNWGIPENKICYVPFGRRNYARAQADAYTPQECGTHKRNRFGFFGQLVDNKGVHVLLNAVDLLREEGFLDFRVEINGANLKFASPAVRSQIEGFMASEMQRPVAERNVVLNGSYDLKNVQRRMDRIDWCVVPSIWWENSPLVLAEALMFRKPVICSNVGSMAERVSHGLNGLNFEMGDAAALARVLKQAASEEGIWDRFVAALPPPPSLEAMVDGFRDIYKC